MNPDNSATLLLLKIILAVNIKQPADTELRIIWKASRAKINFVPKIHLNIARRYGNNGAVINSFVSKLKFPFKISSLWIMYLWLSGPSKLSMPERLEKIYLNKNAKQKIRKNLLFWETICDCIFMKLFLIMMIIHKKTFHKSNLYSACYLSRDQ